jgi:invasion protein IalB
MLIAAVGIAGAQAPQRTTATYEDWTVRCEVRPGPPPQRTCEMIQATQVQGQANPVTQIAIGRAAKTEPLKVVFQVPINVWLPNGVKLAYADKEAPLAVGFQRCVPTGCFAETDLKDDLVKRLRTLTENGKLEFKDAAQRDVALPVSFKGFGAAFDAMAKE